MWFSLKLPYLRCLNLQDILDDFFFYFKFWNFWAIKSLNIYIFMSTIILLFFWNSYFESPITTMLFGWYYSADHWLYIHLFLVISFSLWSSDWIISIDWFSSSHYSFCSLQSAKPTEWIYYLRYYTFSLQNFPLILSFHFSIDIAHHLLIIIF